MVSNSQAYKEVKKEKPPFVVSSEPEAEVESMSIPDELKCGLCYDLLNDAVMTPCCAESFCDECMLKMLTLMFNFELKFSLKLISNSLSTQINQQKATILSLIENKISICIVFVNYRYRVTDRNLCP